MKTYNVTFDRVGRDHDVPPQTFKADGEEALADAVLAFIRPRMRSRDIDVSVDMEAGEGQIYAGFHNGGTFYFHEEDVVLAGFSEGER